MFNLGEISYELIVLAVRMKSNRKLMIDHFVLKDLIGVQSKFKVILILVG